MSTIIFPTWMSEALERHIGRNCVQHSALAVATALVCNPNSTTTVCVDPKQSPTISG